MEWIKSGLRSYTDERKWRGDKKEVRFLVRLAKEEQVTAHGGGKPGGHMPVGPCTGEPFAEQPSRIARETPR